MNKIKIAALSALAAGSSAAIGLPATTTAIAVVGAARSLRPIESKVDLGRLVFWYGVVGAAVVAWKYDLLPAKQRGLDPIIEDEDLTEAINSLTFPDEITVPLVTKLEFIERPGLYGNVDPDVTRYTLCYETDDLDEAGIIAQVSRREFEALRDKIEHWVLARTTVVEIKAAVVSALSDLTAQRQPGF